MPAFLKFKASVKVPYSTIIAAAFINAANEIGLDGNRLVTSGNDSVHGPHSKHYTDEALDFRTHDLTTAQKHALKDAVKARLGADYDIILESEGGSNEHLHVEHDPKRRA